MKRLISLSTGLAIALTASLNAIAMEPETQLDGIALKDDGNSWSVSATSSDGSSELVGENLTRDSGVIVDSVDGSPAFLKYTALDSDSGVPLVVLVQGDSVYLAWEKSEVDSTVAVYRDDVLLDSFTSSEAESIDVSSIAGSAETYRVVETTVNTDNDDESPTTTSSFSEIPVTIPVNQTKTAVAVAAAAALATTSTFRQNTFIPDQYVDSFPIICNPVNSETYRFLGNNRSWSSADGAGFKTRMDVVITWKTSPTVSFTKKVGETVRQIRNNVTGTWSNDGKPLTAQNPDMTITVSSKSINSVAFKLHQNVVNPFCIPGLTNGIASDTNVVIYREGYVTGSITYLAMPNYEIYAKQDSKAYSTLARLSLVSLYCLTPGFGAACNSAASF